MSQGSLVIQTTGTLSGLGLVNAVNDALANLTSLASGSTDPSTLSGGVAPYSFWLDTGAATPTLKMRNAANTGWAAVGTISGTNFVPNLENADISTALGYTPANKAGDTFSGDVFSSTKFDAPIVRASTKFVFADGSEQTTAATGGTAAFPSGTIMLFAQTTAPTGWTKSTAHNNKALRVVSGTAGSGGSVDFTTAFASKSITGSVSGTVAGHTLTTAEMPSHNHSININGNNGDSDLISSNSFGNRTDTASNYGYSGAGTATNNSLMTATGSSNSHSHGFSASFTGNAVNLAVQYVDVILATKN